MKFGRLMMKLFLTLSFLLVLEIISSAVLPGIGIVQFRPAFHILIVCYLGYRLNSPYFPLIIFIIEMFHGVFTIEGGSFGTFAGILIGILVSRLKEMMNFSSTPMQILMAFFLQWAWFLIISSVIYLKVESTPYILNRLWVFIPESIALSLFSPFMFGLLNRIWTIERGSDEVSMGNV